MKTEKDVDFRDPPISRPSELNMPMQINSENRILTLATAGLRPDQGININHARSPRVDYLELKTLLDMDILNYSVYDQTRLGKFLRYLETKLRSDLYLTLVGLVKQKAYPAVFTMSERAGIPYSFLQRFLPGKKALISMFTSWSQLQERTITRLNLFAAMDLIIVKSRAQQQHFIKLNAPKERIKLIPFGVDHRFFSPEHSMARKNFIMTVGEIKNRDYATLFQAVAGMQVKLLAAASGGWYAREKNTQLEVPIPGNVIVSKQIPAVELRSLYAQSKFVVVPLYDTQHSAGATTILEAMSMARAVIVSRSQGILDYVVDGETCLLVSPGNVDELREAISYLSNHPEEADRLGRNARKRVEDELNMDVYINRINHTLREFLSTL